MRIKIVTKTDNIYYISTPYHSLYELLKVVDRMTEDSFVYDDEIAVAKREIESIKVVSKS